MSYYSKPVRLSDSKLLAITRGRNRIMHNTKSSEWISRYIRNQVISTNNRIPKSVISSLHNQLMDRAKLSGINAKFSYQIDPNNSSLISQINVSLGSVKFEITKYSEILGFINSIKSVDDNNRDDLPVIESIYQMILSDYPSVDKDNLYLAMMDQLTDMSLSVTTRRFYHNQSGVLAGNMMNDSILVGKDSILRLTSRILTPNEYLILPIYLRDTSSKYFN